MGRRDFRWRETKKPKKGAKKSAKSTILPPPATVEVVKKGKKAKGPAEEE